MLLILSSAKTVVFDEALSIPKKTQPLFGEERDYLVNALEQFSPKQLEKLLGVRESLAQLNYQRYQDFKISPKQAAILAYRGEVFKQIEITKLSETDYLFAQEHLRIISGLYGLLRPLDEISPYRLEMSSRLKTEKAENLYQFWTEKITQQLNQELRKQKTKILINLASEEYFRGVKTEQLNFPILKVSFKEIRGGKLKTIGLVAKKNRGTMMNWILQNHLDDPSQLKDYSGWGYSYCESLSNEEELTFIKAES